MLPLNTLKNPSVIRLDESWRFGNQNLSPSLIQIFCRLIPVILSFCLSQQTFAEIFWSPDSRWLSLRIESSRESIDHLKPGWIFEPESVLESYESQSDNTLKKTAIWIGRNDLKLWYKVAETSPQLLYLTQPAWAIDGRSLFYGAVRKDSKNQNVWQILQINSILDLNSTHVVWEKTLPESWTVPEMGTRSRKILGNVTSGPDNLLVFSDPTADGLILFRTDSKEIVARMPEAQTARISPTGEFVAWLRSDFWPPRESDLMLTMTSNGSQETHFRNVLPDSIPFFSRVSSDLLVTRHLPPPSGMKVPDGSDWPEICRISLSTSRSRRFATIVPTPILPVENLTGFSFALNPDEDTLLYSPSISTRPSEIVWFLPKTSSTHKRFPPIDLRTDARALSLSADRELALRFGTPAFRMEEDGLPAAICQLEESPLILPITPDDDSAGEWVLFLARRLAKTLDQDTLSTGLTFSEKPQQHFYLVPHLGEFPGMTTVANRLKRFSEMGLMAIGIDPVRPNPANIEKLTGWQLEAAVVFLILTNQHDLALTTLNQINYSQYPPATRGRYFALKVQELIETGHEIEASSLIESLLETELNVQGTFEFDGLDSYQIGEQPKSTWREFLEKLKEATVNPPLQSIGRNPNNPLGHFNPDDPENDPDLRTEPVGDRLNGLDIQMPIP